MRTPWLPFLTLAGACATQASPPVTPFEANDDSLDVEMNMPASIGVLANDSGVEDGAVLVLASTPANGTATLAEDGTLSYTPTMNYLGDDSVDYMITNPDGKVVTGHVAITVGCATCAIGSTATLTWDADPTIATDMLVGYRMYLGTTDDTSMMTKIDDILLTRTGFDPTMPTVTYDCWADLHLRVGDSACFALTAYNAVGESGFSNAACITVKAHMAMKVGL